MLNYEEELKKFQPCKEVYDVEGAVHMRDTTDVIDILKAIVIEKGEDSEE